MRERRNIAHPGVVVRRWQIGIAFTAITLSFVIGLLWLAHVSHEETQHNRDRIRDIFRNQQAIQRSRVFSCKQTYRSFHDVLVPLFPPAKKQTPEIHRSLVKLNRLISQLVDRCDTQTSNGGTP